MVLHFQVDGSLSADAVAAHPAAISLND